MKKIRVLIVDDSVVIRKIISDVLSEENDIEVVGTAANGNIALQKISQLAPDIVTLDVEMPELDGIQTLKEIRKKFGKLPVIMFSTLTERGAGVTIDALSGGATDYVTKPANVGSVSAACEKVKHDLGNKIRAICIDNPIENKSFEKVLHATAPPLSAIKNPQLPHKIEIIAIGVSTGGPDALHQILPEIPEDFSIPILIVQHMPPVFTKVLAERLNQQAKVNVCEACDRMKILPGNIYIAPGDYHMKVKDILHEKIIQLNQDPHRNSCRPSVDVLFESLALTCAKNTLAIVLTGMGNDGYAGTMKLSQAGSLIYVQDQATSVIWGMPGYVAKANLAHKILPLKQIASEIIQASYPGGKNK